MSTMTAPGHKTIPGPHSLNPLKSTFAFQRAPLQFLTELQKRYGCIAQFRLAIWPIVFISHPDYIKYILQDNHRNYDKDAPLFQIARPMAGDGLVTTAGGNSWLRRRRLAQPAFHRQRIAALGTLMTGTTLQLLQRWDTYAREQQVFNIAEEMTNLTLQIVSKALFNVDMSVQTNNFGQAFSQVMVFLTDYLSMPFPPLFVRSRRNHRFWSGMQMIDTIAHEVIRTRRQQQEDVGDLLWILLNAVDENGQRMDEKQLRDEIVTLLIAGYETSATALAWIWYLLTQHPEVQERLDAELDQILAGRAPTVEDLPQLNYTRMVIEEAMRLYSPAWLSMRRALQDDEIGGYHIRANSSILWSTYFPHRHPDFWEKPEQFYPEHFSEELSAKRPRHAYLPFGAGPRMCLGHALAMTEMPLILATIAQQYRVSLAPGHHVEPEPLLSLRPKNGVLVSIEHR